MESSITGLQFIHVDWTTQSGGKARCAFTPRHGDAFNATGWKPSDIFAEVMRRPGHHPHVIYPGIPIPVFGYQDAFEVQKDIDAWLACRQLVDGRKYAINRPVLVNGVISFPRERSDAEWRVFCKRTVEWLKRKYGDALRCVIAHQDEAHPHLHYYATPRYGYDASGKAWADAFGTVHQGYAARNGERERNANAKGGNWHAGGGKMNTAFIRSMQSLQDEFHHEVARFHNLARKGPSARRLPRHIAVVRALDGKKIADDLVAAERAERESRAAKELAQQQLSDAGRIRRNAERYARELMAAAEKAHAEFEDWKRHRQAKLKHGEKALEAERERVAKAERDAVATLKKHDVQISFLEDGKKRLEAENKTLREQLAEMRGEFSRVLKQISRDACGPSWYVHDKYINDRILSPDSRAGKGGSKPAL